MILPLPTKPMPYTFQKKLMLKPILRAMACAALLVAMLGAQPRLPNTSIAAVVLPPASRLAPVKVRVIVGALIIDGSGRKAYPANLRIVGDRIADIGPFAPRPGEERIDARGLVIAPGFIDIHNH